MSDLKLKIVTPDKLFYDDECDYVIARGVEGDIGILKDHTPFVTLLQIGRMVIKKNGEERIAAVAGGYIDVRQNNITVVSDACEWQDEIDIKRALKAKERAEKTLSEKGGDTFKAELSLKKAINRLNIGDGK